MNKSKMKWETKNEKNRLEKNEDEKKERKITQQETHEFKWLVHISKGKMQLLHYAYNQMSIFFRYVWFFFFFTLVPFAAFVVLFYRPFYIRRVFVRLFSHSVYV